MTADELTVRWNQRDALYRMRKVGGVYQALDASEQEAVVTWRRKEADHLPDVDRIKALSLLASWTAPVSS